MIDATSKKEGMPTPEFPKIQQSWDALKVQQPSFPTKLDQPGKLTNLTFRRALRAVFSEDSSGKVSMGKHHRMAPATP